MTSISYSLVNPFNLLKHLNSYINFEKKEPLENELFNSFDSIIEYFNTNPVDVNQWDIFISPIKKIVEGSKEHLAPVDKFIQDILDIGFKVDAEKTIVFLCECMDLEILEGIAKWKSSNQQNIFDKQMDYENIFQWISHKIPPPKELKLQRQNPLSERKKYSSIIFSFIPTILNIFLDTYKILDPQKKYTTFYDKYLVFNILIKFFLIPYFLGKLLEPLFITSMKAYLSATLIIASVGLLIAAYQKWIKPIPENFVNCENLNHARDLGLLNHPTGQARELAELQGHLLNDSCILLVGPSGSGKTALIDHFIQLQNQMKLPKKLQKLHIHRFDCSELSSMFNTEHTKIITLLKEQMRGYEKDVLLIFEEFHQIAERPAVLNVFKDLFLNARPSHLLIASLTEEEYRMLQKKFGVITFDRRVVKQEIKKPSDEQIEKILLDSIRYDRIQNEKKVPVHPNAIKKIVELSKKGTYFPELGRACKAENLLTRALGHTRINYYKECIPFEITEAKENRDLFRVRRDQSLKGDYLNACENYKKLKNQFEEDRNQIEYIQSLFQLQLKLESNLDDLYFYLKDDQVEGNGVSDKIKKRYLLLDFFGLEKIKFMIQTEIDKIQNRRIVQVDEDLILNLFKEKLLIKKMKFEKN